MMSQRGAARREGLAPGTKIISSLLRSPQFSTRLEPVIHVAT
jgi:hypothetical protein